MNYTQEKYIKVPISSGSIPSEDLPTVCRSLAGTLCGSFLTSNGPCRRFSVRGCPLRRLPGYRLVEATP